MADKSIDPQVAKTAMMSVMEAALAKMSGIVSTEQPQVVEKEVIEYENRLRVTGMEKFNAPSFISVINFYLSQADMDRHKGAKGAMIFYVDSENSGKLFKALGFPTNDDEDDISMMNSCGEVCNVVGKGFKDELVKAGYVDLFMSPAHNYKNSILEGVEFSTDQTTMHEFCFFYWKRKSIVVELTLAAVPMKR